VNPSRRSTRDSYAGRVDPAVVEIEAISRRRGRLIARFALSVFAASRKLRLYEMQGHVHRLGDVAVEVLAPKTRGPSRLLERCLRGGIYAQDVGLAGLPTRRTVVSTIQARCPSGLLREAGARSRLRAYRQPPGPASASVRTARRPSQSRGTAAQTVRSRGRDARQHDAVSACSCSTEAQ
jgi:hypothetical protein